MSKQKAKNHYLGIEGHTKLNCGQAIVSAFRDKFPVPEDIANAFSGFGGGKAPGGLCAALYAAHVLLEKNMPDKSEDCLRSFSSCAGALRCGEIRKLRKLTCVGCVEEAARLLESYL